MPSAGLEHAIPAIVLPQTYPLDHRASGIGCYDIMTFISQMKKQGVICEQKYGQVFRESVR
jgi:hypothetical protein